jgi:hypothetical protein
MTSATTLWSGMSQPAADGSLWCRRFRPSTGATVRLVCLPQSGHRQQHKPR